MKTTEPKKRKWNLSCAGSQSCSGIQSTCLTKTPDQVCHTYEISSLIQSKQMWHHQAMNVGSQSSISYRHLPSRDLTLLKALPTFLEQCYAVSGIQLLHSTCFLTATGMCRLYVFVQSQKKTSTSGRSFLVRHFMWLVLFSFLFFF